jgi:drug/metabolite transporter (DMT)-like permease
MGVVAPVGAVVSAAIPALVGFLLEGLPTHLQLLGFGIAFLSVWLISSTKRKTKMDLASLKLSILAGVGFSIFFIFLDRVSPEVVFWPLISSRAASLVVMFLAVWVRKDRGVPAKPQIPLVVFTGIFDTGGNIFYALASSYGRLDVSAVVGSLYPGVTVLLAWFVLKERLTFKQWLGVGTALASLVLISI